MPVSRSQIASAVGKLHRHCELQLQWTLQTNEVVAATQGSAVPHVSSGSPRGTYEDGELTC